MSEKAMFSIYLHHPSHMLHYSKIRFSSGIWSRHHENRLDLTHNGKGGRDMKAGSTNMCKYDTAKFYKCLINWSCHLKVRAVRRKKHAH